MGVTGGPRFCLVFTVCVCLFTIIMSNDHYQSRRCLKLFILLLFFPKQSNLQAPLLHPLTLYKVLRLVKAHDLYLVPAQQERGGFHRLKEIFQVSTLT